MANYVDSTVFINGSKRAIVDFLNKGLKNNKLSLRVSTRMPGEQIASLLADLDREHCLATFSFLPHPRTFDHWDTTNKMLSFSAWYGKNDEIYDFMLAHPSDFQPVEKLQEEEELPFDVVCEEPIGSLPPRFEWDDYDRALKIMHPELIASYRKYVRGYRRAVAYQKKKYGVVGWYDWAGKHHGCKWAAFEKWKCLKDENGIMCLTAEVESPWAPPITFFEYMNALEGITVYAYGREYFYWGYKYNGRTGESVDVEVKESDSRYQTLLQEYAAEKGVDLNSEEAKKGYIPGFYPEEVAGRLLEEHLDKYKAEINSELGLNEPLA